MFELIEGKVDRPFRERNAKPAAVSIIGHLVVLGLVAAVPLMLMTDRLPEIPTMMTFVVPAAAMAPPPAPPPPPPAAAARPSTAPQDVPKPVPAAARVMAAPVQMPREILPEPVGEPPGAIGVEGGVPGGVSGGAIGGMSAPPPPPPPPPPRPSGPVRIGGQIQAPALVHRVEPAYPQVAIAAKISGAVILEATVDEEGRVTEVRVVQSRPFLDAAAREAVRQWRYTPLILNDHATPFVLTVHLNFSFH